MASSTLGVDLSSAAYVALSAGHATVVVVAEQKRARIHVGQSLPVVGTDDWFPLEPGTANALEMEGLGASDNVYAMPDGPLDAAHTVAMKVRVLRR